MTMWLVLAGAPLLVGLLWGVPMALITRRDRAEDAQKRLEKLAKKQAKATKKQSRRDEAAAAGAQLTLRQRVQQDAVRVVLGPLRQALAKARGLEDELALLQEQIVEGDEAVVEAQDRVAVAEHEVPKRLGGRKVGVLVRVLACAALPIAVAFAYLDYQMFKATYDQGLATAYAVLMFAVVSAVGLWLFAAVPPVLRRYSRKTRRKQGLAFLSLAGALVIGGLMVATLLWLSPHRSEATNADQVAAARSTYDDDLKAQKAGADISPLTVASDKSALDQAEATAEADKQIDRVTAGVAVGADLISLEGGLLYLAYLWPLQKDRLLVGSRKAHVADLRSQYSQVYLKLQAEGRQVATNMFQWLDANGDPRPELTIDQAIQLENATESRFRSHTKAAMDLRLEELALSRGQDAPTMVQGTVVPTPETPETGVDPVTPVAPVEVVEVVEHVQPVGPVPGGGLGVGPGAPGPGPVGPPLGGRSTEGIEEDLPDLDEVSSAYL